jgi:dolichol-phosphate mannosyltransferase
MLQDRFLVVLPTYNERANLPLMVDALAEERRRAPMPGDVLVVDDASPDDTGAVADALAGTRDWLHVLHRPRKEGLGCAYVDAFRWALAREYTHVLEMDCDLSHPPEALPRLLAAAADADLVLGSRYVPGGAVRGWPLHRRLISRFGCAYARAILGVSIGDLTGGYKCFRRRVLEAVDLDAVQAQGYVFQVELTYRALRMGARVVEVPITFEDRARGSSKMTRRIVAEAAWKVPALRVRALAGGLEDEGVLVAPAFREDPAAIVP